MMAQVLFHINDVASSTYHRMATILLLRDGQLKLSKHAMQICALTQHLPSMINCLVLEGGSAYCGPTLTI